MGDDGTSLNLYRKVCANPNGGESKSSLLFAASKPADARACTHTQVPYSTLNEVIDAVRPGSTNGTILTTTYNYIKANMKGGNGTKCLNINAENQVTFSDTCTSFTIE